jgi:lipoprotein-anchoring transpeptidase ErfK/SrfK
MHRPPSPRRSLLTFLSATASSLLLVACSSNPAPPSRPDAARDLPAGTQPTAPPQIAVDPVDGSKEVALDKMVVVRVDRGMIDSVSVHPTGDSVSFLRGILSAGDRTWTASQPLEQNTSYVVEVSAHDGGDQSTARTAFSTLAPTKRLVTTTNPQDGETVGVGMPISLRFNYDIPSDHRASLLSKLTVASTPATVGAWHWFAPNEVHWRPKDYWQTGTKVTLTATLLGYNAGDNVYGLGNWSMSFTVGDKHVSVIDATTHQMVVSSNDKQLWTWPVSTGVPNKWPTISGTLVVWYKQQDVLMDSLSIGIPRNAPGGYYEHVYWDTAISLDGFFVHSAPWSVWAQGSQNVSHGCVNLSQARATTFFNFSQKGDVVIVKGTSRTADYSDGEGDWQIPFDQFDNTGGSTSVTAPPSQAPSQNGGL